jgi:hypothetical protein
VVVRVLRAPSKSGCSISRAPLFGAAVVGNADLLGPKVKHAVAVWSLSGLHAYVSGHIDETNIGTLAVGWKQTPTGDILVTNVEAQTRRDLPAPQRRTVALFRTAGAVRTLRYDPRLQIVMSSPMVGERP